MPHLPPLDAPDILPIERLLRIMARLRDPETGCPWDVEQTFQTIAPHTVEEAYEVADAIERGAPQDIMEELGDLLLQVVFHAQIANDAGLFDFHDVAGAIGEKLVRRHPHVFGPTRPNKTAEDQARDWEAGKATERAAKARKGVLDDVALNLPALMRAEKLQKRVARVGFDWPDIDQVTAKITEEAQELTNARAIGTQDDVVEEMGDLLFAVVNLARHLKIDPEVALRQANVKFTKRFQYIEQALEALGKTPTNSNLAEMEALWTQAKTQPL